MAGGQAITKMRFAATQPTKQYTYNASRTCFYNFFNVTVRYS